MSDSEQIKSVAHLAKVEGQSDDIFYGSVLAVQGVFVEVVRSRWRGRNRTDDVPYYWEPDVTPREDETGDDGHPRKLYVESAYLEFPDAKNFRPAVLVDAADCVPIKDVVGNIAGVHRPSGLVGHYSRCQISMEVLVLDESRGGCSVLADLTWFHLLACRQLIRQEFRIHEMTEPRRARVVPARRDKDIWECPITFEVQVEMRWFTRPVAVLLQEVRAKLALIGAGDAGLGATEIALYGGHGPRGGGG